MELSSGDADMMDVKPDAAIPVCNLFSDSNEGPDGFLASVETVDDVQKLQSSVPQEPGLCNVFANEGNSAFSDDDIFSKISDDIDEKNSVNSSDSHNGQSNLNPQEMETLRLNRSVDSFIVEDMTEQDTVSEDLPIDIPQHPTDLDLKSEEQILPEEEITDEALDLTPKPIIASPSFISVTSFSISPEPEEGDLKSDDNIIDESMDAQSEMLEKLTLKDDQNDMIEEAAFSFSVTPSETEIKVDEESEDQKIDDSETNEKIEEKPVEEILTTGQLFSSVTNQNMFPSPISEGKNEEDPFAAALSNSELNRRNDAWLPSPDTRAILTATVINQKAPDLEMEKITRPGLSTSEVLEDPVKELVVRMTGSETILKRENLTKFEFGQNRAGIEKLIETGNLRAAANLCAKLLATHAQGFGQATQLTTNTSETLQLWYNRIFVLTKLKLYETAAAEIASFKDLDNPDLYYDFYSDVYPGRRGSMVAFSFRLLHAEFPRYVDKPQDSLIRLHKILNICTKILRNLNEGKTEIGEMTDLKPSDVEESIKQWTARKVQTLFSIGNTLMQLKDYTLAVEVYGRILKIHPEEAVALQSGIGRIYLHLGDIRSAQQIFTEAEKAGSDLPQFKVQLILNRGFMYIGTNNWKEALSQFELALNTEPRNIIALNNKAVCLLYLGKLKDAIAVLETGTCEQTTPVVSSKISDIGWQETMLQGLISNLSTLYELESSRYLLKKRAMFLKQIAPTCSDSFDTSCFKEI